MSSGNSSGNSLQVRDELAAIKRLNVQAMTNNSPAKESKSGLIFTSRHRSVDKVNHPDMRNTRILAAIVKGSGWFLGLPAAAFTDYWILSRLATRVGGRVVSAGIGLIVGSILIYVFVLAAGRAAEQLTREPGQPSGERISRRKSPAEQIPVGSRVMIGLLAILIAAGMLISGSGMPLIFR